MTPFSHFCNPFSASVSGPAWLRYDAICIQTSGFVQQSRSSLSTQQRMPEQEDTTIHQTDIAADTSMSTVCSIHAINMREYATVTFAQTREGWEEHPECLRSQLGAPRPSREQLAWRCCPFNQQQHACKPTCGSHWRKGNCCLLCTLCTTASSTFLLLGCLSGGELIAFASCSSNGIYLARLMLISMSTCGSSSRHLSIHSNSLDGNSCSRRSAQCA